MISKGHRERLAKNCECVIGAAVVYVTLCYSTVEYRIAGFHELLLEESARECVPKKTNKKSIKRKRTVVPKHVLFIPNCYKINQKHDSTES